jgi:catechol 2,3-dioxygenase-like lactoylglutathione lyase family enzyme
MKQHLHLITLGVRDFEKSKKFYAETLGWKPTSSNDGISFFHMGRVLLSIYSREKLAEDAMTSPDGSGFSGITLRTTHKAKPKWMRSLRA